MSPSGAEVIRQIKSQIEEVDPSEVNSAASNGNGSRPVLIDVRESEEWDAGHIPGARHVPRGYLESRIEGAVPDRSANVVLYCASGNRSALAAHTLKELHGLRERELDDRRHHALEGPRLRRRDPEVALQGAARALLAPPARPRDRARGPDQAARGEGAAARRRRPRLADGALPRRRGRGHARHRRRRRRRPLQPAAPGHPHHRRHRHAQGRLRRARGQGDQPGRGGRQVPRRASTPRTSWTSSRATT